MALVARRRKDGDETKEHERLPPPLFHIVMPQSGAVHLVRTWCAVRIGTDRCTRALPVSKDLHTRSDRSVAPQRLAGFGRRLQRQLRRSEASAGWLTASYASLTAPRLPWLNQANQLAAGRVPVATARQQLQLLLERRPHAAKGSAKQKGPTVTP